VTQVQYCILYRYRQLSSRHLAYAELQVAKPTSRSSRVPVVHVPSAADVLIFDHDLWIRQWRVSYIDGDRLYYYHLTVDPLLSYLDTMKSASLPLLILLAVCGVEAYVPSKPIFCIACISIDLQGGALFSMRVLYISYIFFH
jgi:hypothetical protein